MTSRSAAAFPAVFVETVPTNMSYLYQRYTNHNLTLFTLKVWLLLIYCLCKRFTNLKNMFIDTVSVI